MRSYPWPASKIDGRLMSLLHATRERERPKRPITVLVAEAVRDKVVREFRIEQNSDEPKEAA